MEKRYDVIAVGNALVDVLAEVSDDLLEHLGLTKASMQLCSAEESRDIYENLPPSRQQSGGSVANSLAGFAALGGRGAFLGMIGKDAFGEVFAHDLQALRIDFAPAYSASPTGRCLVMVTDDAERTMATCLGAAAEFNEGGVEEDMIKAAHILYLEGYLFDSDSNKQAFYKAADCAKKHDVRVALTLSDGFCVDRHRQDFKKFISQSVDILFANEDESLSLSETDNHQTALAAISDMAPIAFITQGENGALIAEDGNITATEAVPCRKLVDTTGAGDQFAAGVLFGMRQGRSLPDSAHLGAHLASLVISDYGGRLPQDSPLFPQNWQA